MVCRRNHLHVRNEVLLRQIAPGKRAPLHIEYIHVPAHQDIDENMQVYI